MKRRLAMFLAAMMLTVMISVPASAETVGFRRSCLGKPAPSISSMTDSQGRPVAGIIRDANGNEIEGISADSITITPVRDASSVPALAAAYEQLKSASSLAEIVPGIVDVLKQIAPNVSVNDLVVRDLFDVTLDEAAKKVLDEPGNSITIRFDINQNPDQLLLVLHNMSGTNWEVIPTDQVKVNADGSVDVAFTSLSPIAFATDQSGASVSGGVTSPQTGYADDGSVMMIAVILGVSVLGIFFVRKKTA